MLILGSLYTLCHYCEMVATTVGKRSQSIWSGLKSYKLRMRVQHFGTNKYVYSIGFLRLQLIHILTLSPQVTVYSAWIFAEQI